MMAIIHVVPWSMCVIFFVLVISCENQITDLFNYRKLTSTLSDVYCLQGEKGDMGNIGKVGPQVSFFHTSNDIS